MLRRALEASMMESTSTTATEGGEEGKKENEDEGKKDGKDNDSAQKRDIFYSTFYNIYC